MERELQNSINYLKFSVFHEVKKFLTKIITFFKEVKVEMKKVNWPTRQEAIKYSLIVVAASVILAALLGGLDFIFTTIINRFIF